MTPKPVLSHTWGHPEALLALLTLTLGLATLFYGADFPLAKASLALAALGAWGVAAGVPGGPVSRWLTWGIGLPCALVGAWVLVQLMPWGNAGYWSTSPVPAPWPAFSAAPGETLAQLSLFLSYAMLGVATFRLTAVPQGAVRLLRAVAGVGVLAAAYGAVVFLMGNHMVAFQTKVFALDKLTSTFIYHNAYAAFAGVGMLALLALFLERCGEISSRLSLTQQVKAFYWLVLKPGIWLVPLWFLCVFTLVYTASRAGVLSVVWGHIVFFIVLGVVRKPLRLPILVLALGMFMLLALALSTSGALLGERLSLLTTAVDGRVAIHATTWRLFAESSWFGHGLGTFESLFPTVKSVAEGLTVAGHTEHAHHLYLELLTELGLPATLMLAVAATSVLAVLLNGARIRRRAVIFPVLGLAVMAQLAVHSLFDFVLAVPAIAVGALMCVVMGLAQSFPPRAEGARIRPRMLTWSVALTVGSFGVWLWAAEGAAYRAESTLAQLSHPRASVSPQALQGAASALQICLDINPFNIRCAANRAQVLASQTSLLSPQDAQAPHALEQTQRALESALSLAPANGHLWFRLAQVRALQHKTTEAAQALVQSVVFAPVEVPLGFQRQPLVAQLWPMFDATDQALFTYVDQQLAHLDRGPFAAVLRHLPEGPASGIRAP